VTTTIKGKTTVTAISTGITTAATPTSATEATTHRH